MSTPAPEIVIPTATGIREMTLDAIEPLRAKKIAIVGPSGAGKTWLAATWPRPAFIDTDHNIATLKQSEWRTYAQAPADKKILLAQPRDIRDRQGIAQTPIAFWQALEQMSKWSEREDVETIIVDTLTSLSVAAMALGVHVAGQDKRSRTKAEARTKTEGVLLYTEADFGAEMSCIEQLMEQLPQIGQTVIFNCHVRIEYADSGALLAYKPLITGNKHRESFGRWFNEVWWLEVRGSGNNTKRVLQARPDNLHQFVKTTIGLPQEIENPTYEKIKAAMKVGGV